VQRPAGFYDAVPAPPSAILLNQRKMRPKSIPSSSPGSDPALLAAISLTSFSTLLLELALTRLFSVVLFYHFAFLAISVALLGLGAGGVFAYLWRNWLARFETRRLAATLSSGNAAAIVFTLLVVLHVPVSLDLSRGNLFHLAEKYLTSAVPFFLTGLTFSVVFARAPRPPWAPERGWSRFSCRHTLPLAALTGYYDLRGFCYTPTPGGMAGARASEASGVGRALVTQFTGISLL